LKARIFTAAAAVLSNKNKIIGKAKWLFMLDKIQKAALIAQPFD